MYFSKRADTNATIQLPPKPVVVSPSGSFDGNDGKWSTFLINIGSDNDGNGQNFKVLISTSSPLTLVPQQTDWCNNDCAKDRGILLYNNQQPLGAEDSQYWQKAGTYVIPDTDSWSNDSLAGNWGLDNVGLGLSSKESLILAERYVVKYIFEDFFLGSFGLTVGEVGPNGGSKPTFLSEFANSNQIASSSYGYTAGAHYRNNGKGVLGNLVLGGYDKSRLTRQGTSISMANEKDNALIVDVISIMYEPDRDVEVNTLSFTQEAFKATIDSTLPYLMLPVNICDKFKEEFGLEYNNDTNLYTVNSTAHNSNIQKNATVSFKIADAPMDSAEFATITLPYAAFDLQASFPIYEDARNYFPIKRSENNVNILGRTFLQEAYIIVDYERANFTVAPARFSQPMPDEELETIFNKTFVLPTVLPTPHNSNDGMSPGAIAGIVVGVVLVFLLAGLGAFFFWKKKRNTRQERLQQNVATSEIDTTAAGNQFRRRNVSELTGSDVPHSPKPSMGGYYGSDHKLIPPISELSPESPPSELYSPLPGNEGGRDGYDYFAAGSRVRRRGAQRDRESSGQNTPRTPIAELPGDGIKLPVSIRQLDNVGPVQDLKHSRGPSNVSLSSNIDGILAESRQETKSGKSSEELKQAAEPGEATVEGSESQPHHELDRRPSHNRGLSDVTVQSDSTAVSQPTPEELERWETMSADDRPMSPVEEVRKS
ncbi:acid protease [Dothidotthia symphoricarpi CBS 119687]|uniref:Acid protease n=1 Tax=Dothidotthia symphoricarpi CBS 119687 TaxID=1392245 RepID=A0A6A6A653_9PLEO|nr:acid protease [Dothidotthia symphoricarpi CBS 119687]KAF2126554.1 acid protease [Dothidotthia symphoricarpi CBS 119687]